MVVMQQYHFNTAVEKCFTFQTKIFILPNFYWNILRAGLEKSSVLPVLDRFLSLKTDFVLNKKQKNRSIKIVFFFLFCFFRPILKTVYNSYLSRQFTVNFTPFNTLSCFIRLHTPIYYMTSGCHQLITPMSEWNGSVHFTQHVGLKDWSVFVAFFWQLATKYFHVLIQFEINVWIQFEIIK